MSFRPGDIAKVTKQLDGLNRAIQSALPQAAEAGAGVLKAEAERRVPVRSGKLKGGIQSRKGKASERTAVNSGVHLVYNRVFYADAVERGRYKRPFMRPAAQAANGTIINAMETVIKRESGKVL